MHFKANGRENTTMSMCVLSACELFGQLGLQHAQEEFVYTSHRYQPPPLEVMKKVGAGSVSKTSEGFAPRAPPFKPYSR